MGLFDELDLKDVPNDPNDIPNNTYPAVLTDIKPYTKDGTDKKSLIFEFKITEGDFRGVTVAQFQSANKDDSPVVKSYLKSLLISLGVPEDKVDDVDKDDLVNTDVLITTKRTQSGGKTYININKLVLAGSPGASSSGSSAMDF